MTFDQEVASYARRGFIVESQTPTSASLRKPKKFNPWAFIVLTLLGGVPGLIYLFAYWGMKDEVVYLSTDARGNVTRHGGKWTLGSWLMRRAQGRA